MLSLRTVPRAKLATLSGNLQASLVSGYHSGANALIDYAFDEFMYSHAHGHIQSSDILDEMASVRSTYKRAFKELVVTALKEIKTERRLSERNSLLIKSPVTTDDEEEIEIPSESLGNPVLGGEASHQRPSVVTTYV